MFSAGQPASTLHAHQNGALTSPFSLKTKSASAMAANPAHASLKQTYTERASHPDTHPLVYYLLHLISIKKSNLALSADVTTSAELLVVAEETGDSICILKTHADIVADFGDRTIARLQEIARRKRFLIFEDRKFGDIGSTVQKQYTSGPLRIATWASLTNCTLFPGPSIVSALSAAAISTLTALSTSVKTDITASPRTETPSPASSSPSPTTSTFPDQATTRGGRGESFSTYDAAIRANGYTRNRLNSAHSIEATTTIETYSEPLGGRRPSLAQSPPSIAANLDGPSPADQLAELGREPLSRGLLLLAEMSSEGNWCTGAYTDACVQVAREHPEFVIGFIAQRSLNAEEGDNFVTMTPGVSLPPAGAVQGGPRGDGLGQQYNSPQRVVSQLGSDVIIVGRGILNAEDRGREAERYRREGWRAYEERVGRTA